MQSKLPKILFFLLGLALFSYFLSLSNLNNILNQIIFLGFNGFFLIFSIFILYFGSDSVSWQMTFTSIRFNLSWAGRFFVIRMIGEAYNNILPAASLGGEPLKAWILKTNYNISYVDSTSALIISKTVSMLSLVLLIGFAFFLSLDNSEVSFTHKKTAILLLVIAIFSLFTFFVLQRNRVLSKIARFLIERTSKMKFKKFLEDVENVDNTFNRFYSTNKIRLALSFLFASLNWFFGVIELYLIFLFLGRPLTLEDAIILESLIQLVRTMTFFIPSAIGTQEGAFFVGSEILLGSAELGLSASLVRRARDLVWIFLSLLLSLKFDVNR
tara:strand:- start:1481 stop:2461 length:981 start_codon:yes stop_codon:yes gene_type:complete